MLLIVLSLLQFGNAILMKTTNLSNTSVSTELEINEPFVYEFDQTTGDNLQVEMISINRYNMDSNTDFCQLFQLDYQYYLEAIAWVDQSKQSVTTEYRSISNYSLDVLTKPLVELDDLTIEEGDIHLITNNARYIIFNEDFIATDQLSLNISRDDSLFILPIRDDRFAIVGDQQIQIVDLGATVQNQTSISTDQIYDTILMDNLIYVVTTREVLVFDTQLNIIDNSAFSLLVNPRQLSSEDTYLMILDSGKGIFVYDTENSMELTKVIQCDGCIHYQMISDTKFVAITDQNQLVYYENEMLVANITAYGAQKLSLVVDLIIIYSETGSFINYQGKFAGFFLLALPQQIQKIKITLSNIPMVLTRGALMKLNLEKHPAYLECIPQPTNKVDASYFVQVIAKTDKKYFYDFQFQLVEPLVTSSNLPLILGIILGFLLLTVILIFLGVIYFLKFRKARRDAYEEIYKEDRFRSN